MTEAATPTTLISDPELSRCTEALGGEDDRAGFGALSTEAGNLPLEAVEVRGQIAGLLAGVRLRQTFVNHLDRPLEATYIFPLPDRGALQRFELRVADRTVEGQLQERGAARQAYDDAIEQGHRAAIVEEERPDVFTIRVGNIAPGERATVLLHLVVPLSFAAGEATFRFPLVVAPRYIPGAPLPDRGNVGDGTASDTDAVPDASRISPPVLLPGFPSPVRLALSLTVDAPADSELRCSLHATTVRESSGGRRVELVPGERLDRDFYLRYRLAEPSAVASSGQLALSDDDPRPGATFSLCLVPPLADSQRKTARDVVFLLDRSGSMAGWKIVAARRAVARMIDTLSDGDRFGLIAFDHAMEEPELSGKGLAAAGDRHRYRAVEFLARLDARGGTEIARPLAVALDALGKERDAARQRTLVLVTDGQVGNERQLLAAISEGLGDTRIFCVGIDQAVNAGFLGRLADIGHGRCELVESEDRLDEVMAALHRSLDAPVLTELSLAIEGGELEAETLLPAGPRALFAGAPLQLRGRLSRAHGPCRARLSGQTASGEPWNTTVELTPADAGEPQAMVHAAWARAMVRQLEDRFDSDDGDRVSLERRIIETSLAYKVLCRFTAFVAVDRAETVEGVRGNQPARQVQPVELPAGWKTETPAMPVMASPASMTASSGAPRFALMDCLAEEGEAPAPARALRAEAPVGQAIRGAVSAVSGLFRKRASADVPPPPSGAEAETQSGVLKGKFPYFSPAAVRGEALEPADDVFVIGLLLYKMITGKQLFSGDSDFAILTAIRDWDEATLDAERGELGALYPVVRRMLAIDRAARPSAEELMSELAELARSEDWSTEGAFGEIDSRLGGQPRDLGEVLRAGPLCASAATHVASTLADQLALIHRQQKLLRELQPHDVLLSPGGAVSIRREGDPRAQDQRSQRSKFWR